MSRAVDVLIAGGGPAGSAAAIALAAAGHRVVVLERERFPRPQIGESLPPKIEQLLGALGVLAEVQSAGFVRMSGTTIAMGDQLARHPFDPSGGPLGYQVDRGAFDAILLRRAAAAGADVREETSLVAPLFRDDRVIGARVAANGVEEELQAAYVVDAGGSSAQLARALRLRRRESLRTVAISGRWRDARGDESLPPRNTLFEMLEDGWIWSVLRSDGLRNVTLGLDAQTTKARGGPLLELYKTRLAGSRLLAPILDLAHLDGELSAHDATWCAAENPIGPGLAWRATRAP